MVQDRDFRSGTMAARVAAGAFASAIAVGLLGIAGALDDVPDEAPAPTTTTTTTAPCQEDEPCWDCETMGNLVCGPPPVSLIPPLVLERTG